MHIDQLVYFSEVFRTRSINAASLNLMITQQSLSKSIQNLENEYNTQFFIRSAKGVIPTDEGELFYQTVQTILNQLDKFSSALHPNQKFSVCSIGYLNADAPASEKLFTFLQQAYPDIFFNISAFSYHDLFTMPPEEWPNIIFTFMNKSLFNTFALPEKYELKIVSPRASFRIWLNRQSHFTNYKQLSDRHLQAINFIFPKTLYSDITIIQTIYPTLTRENVYIAPTENIFTDLLMNKNYSTTEIMINDTPICFPALQTSSQFILKPLTSLNCNNIYLVLLYHEKFKQLYPVIADFLSQLYNTY